MIAIIGGGITGLAAAWHITQRLGPGGCAVFEADGRPGGKIRTHHTDGLECEDGPDAFLAAKPEAEALCRALDLGNRLVTVDAAARQAFVRRGSRLYPLPEGLTGLVPTRPWPLLTSGLLSPAGRLRAAAEPLMPRRANGDDESVAGFVARRFGWEVWERVAEPLLAGISAGDGTALSLRATLPRLHAAERGGSLLLAAWRRGRGAEPPAGFLALRGGLGTLVDTLVGRLPPGTVRTNARVVRLRPHDDRWDIVLSDGTLMTAASVLLAVPARSAASLLRPHDAQLAETLAAIRTSSSAVVSFAWPRADVRRRLAGSGWLVPRAEASAVIAVSLSSAKFPHRAPVDTLLVRVFLGRTDGVSTETDAALMEAARTEVRTVLGTVTPPGLARLTRWPDGLPQYTLGHLDRVAAIERRAAALPRVRLAGCSYRGLGIPDCIRDGTTMATQLMERTA